MQLRAPARWKTYKMMRMLVKLIAAGLAFLLILIGAAQWMRPDLSKAAPAYSAEVLASIREQREIAFDPSDPSRLPRIQQGVDYTQGKLAPWWPKGQSPVLADLVKAGKLPPVHERTGPEPVVLQGVEGGSGTYGGTWHRVSPSTGDIFHVEYRLANPGLFRWSPLGYPIVPHLAVGMEESSDKREFVVHLRKGVRWSDGHPFTADDILFWWKYENNNSTVGNGLPIRWMVMAGGSTALEKLDEYTLRFRFQHPYGNFREILASYSQVMMRSAAHYWRRYHPDLADPAFLAGELRALGAGSARALYNDRLKRWDNPEAPRLWPWILREVPTGTTYVFVRNPYYFAVDSQGNQLPYIDRLQIDVKSAQTMGIGFTNGEVSMQDRHVRYENYTDLMTRQLENGAAAGFKVYHWYPASRSSWVLHPNLNRRVDPVHPDTAGKAKLLADKRFRQALSMALDRESIVKAEFKGQVRPSQVEPGPQSVFHHQGLANAFIAHDPARANALLDELGLTGRDLDGMRTLPDGSTLTLHLNYTAFTGLGPGQFVVDDWARVGIRAIPKEMQFALFYTKRDAVDFDFMIWSSESDMFPLIKPALFAPVDAESYFAVKWGRWFSRGGLFDSEGLKDIPGARGPSLDHPMRDAYHALGAAQAASSSDEQVRAFKKVLDIAADNLWTINIANSPPVVVIVNNDLHNVPKNALYSGVNLTPSNAGIETYYFGRPVNSAVADTRRQIEQFTPMRRTFEQAADRADATVSLNWTSIAWVSIGVLALFVAALHPFIGKRLALLVPTLLVLSIVVFSIVRLPPGDLLTTRMAHLSETGDFASVQEVDALKKAFHLDDPFWTQYLRWTGLYWFASFDQADRGLLQGHMGLSMDNAQPVNQLIGDRIMLTTVISVATILVSWLIAIPLGIFTAVRRDSAADHVITMLGFLSMSVPPILLALILMAWTGISGLFSPEFATQAHWNWPKVKDLFMHIWVPVLVSATSSTAGLMRVMRANLIDELKKPYVTTARARGLRPVTLLLRYPVRIAFNPFVSGMGQLFPTLVSGGAVVAIVLSLPTVGPQMFAALSNEDQFMAGSMLMVLGVLAVVGTLVADLLLLWLDPRIRYEGRHK